MKLRDPRPALLAALILLLIGTLTVAVVPATAQQFPGGFIQKSYDTKNRPRLTASQIQSFVPSGRGKFTFPAPYNTQGVRITIPSDCGGADCVNYVEYSYWKNINNHQNSDTMYIVLGLNKSKGGTGPTLFSYNKNTDVVTNMGPIFDPSTGWSWLNMGWYFSATMPTKLYITYWHTSSFYRYDILSHNFQQIFDVASRTDIFGGNRWITQLHSSDNDKVHSFTVSDSSTDEMLGCGVYHEDTGSYQYYPKIGNYNECNLDATGRWLVILDGSSDLDNRVIDLQNNSEKMILNQNGRLGHLDMGAGYMVGGSGSVPLPQANLLYKFPLATTTYPVGPMVFYTDDWHDGIANHVSHQNRKIGVPPEQQFACGSNLDTNPRENEIACFRLDTSDDALFIAPVMTDANAPGGDCDYCKYPKGNLDVTGKYFIWTSNMYGNRLDAFIVKVPSQLLVADSGSTTPPPPPPPPPPTDSAPVISAVSAPVISSSGATISWATDKASDSQVEYGPSTSYGTATAVNGTMVTSHGQSLAGLSANTTYHYRVKSKDSAGTTSTSGDFTLTTTGSSTGPSGGGSAPSVAITAPRGGASAKGRIKVTATASDSDGVAGVQFQVDGQNIGAEDTFAPYTITWDSTTVTNGSHLLTAIARDRLGNRATSAPVVVTVKGSRLASAPSSSTQNVTWTRVINAAASGNSLQKTSNCDGCSDSGATSVQQIQSGNGYLQFTASETTTNRAIGLSNGDSNTTRADIDFGVMLWNVSGGIVEIFEDDVYKASAGSFHSGDVFRVAVESGVVKYYKNGALIYTSAQRPRYPLQADTSLWSVGSTIANAVISRTP
ncbi:MAG TPA: Ig-like domain-containing protein [Candidatus Binatia bacterium]|jgi:hypothetical protein